MSLLTTRFKEILGAQGYWEYSFWNREIKCILVHTSSRYFSLNLTLMHSFVKSQLHPRRQFKLCIAQILARDWRARQEKWALSLSQETSKRSVEDPRETRKMIAFTRVVLISPTQIAKTHPKLLQRLFWIPAFYDDFLWSSSLKCNPDNENSEEIVNRFNDSWLRVTVARLAEVRNRIITQMQWQRQSVPVQFQKY